MFDLHTLVMFNFRSYVGEHTFEFPTVPGLYGLQGLNLAKPRLGPNGTGKTTLLDAVHWVLYGSTTRGLRGPNVTAWGQKTCSVKLVLNVGGQISTIFRRHHPNALELDGTTIDQDALLQFIRLGSESFMHTILVPQFGDAFFDLKPALKMNLFTEVLKLEYWISKAQQAAVTAELIDADRTAATKRLDMYETRIRMVDADLVKMCQAEEKFELEWKKTIEDFKSKKTEQYLLREKIQAGLRLDRGGLETARSLLFSNERKLEITRDTGKKLAIKREGFTTKRAALQADQISLGKQRKGLEGIKSTCPTCFQSMDEAHKAKEAKRLEKAAHKLSEEMDLVADDITTVDAEIQTVEKSIAGLTIAIGANRHNANDFDRNISLKLSQLEGVKSSIEELTFNIHENTPINPYTNIRSTKLLEKKRLQEKADSNSSQIRKYEEELTTVNFWVTGFRKIRLSIIDETLQQLEIEVNNNLASLGLVDWRIEFDVERENKSGGMTKGFVVLVHPPGAAKPVVYEAYSGGETQRLRLAGDLGLANLILSRAGLESTIEFFDEPSNHLSDEGVIDLAETLYTRAIASGKRIFLVDHRNIDFNFTGRYTAIIDKNGSHLRYEG